MPGRLNPRADSVPGVGESGAYREEEAAASTCTAGGRMGATSDGSADMAERRAKRGREESRG